VAVVGTIPREAPIRRSTALRLVQEPDERVARAAITDRDVYGAVVLPSRRLLVASAASPAVAQVLQRAFGGVGLRVQDVRPLAAGDPRGLSIFYAVLAWVFGGYLGATILGLVIGQASRDWRQELARLSALAVYAVAARLLGALVAEPILHALSDHYLALACVGMLVVFAAAAATEALQALFGIAGPAIALLAFIVLGNPATGVASARRCCPASGARSRDTQRWERSLCSRSTQASARPWRSSWEADDVRRDPACFSPAEVANLLATSTPCRTRARRTPGRTYAGRYRLRTPATRRRHFHHRLAYAGIARR
jgi:hypothetical protein